MGRIRIELDGELAAFLGRADRPVEAEARALIVTELYRRGRQSRGKAAELLGMSLDAFLGYAAALGIPYVDYTEDEWESEKRAIREVARALPWSATSAPRSRSPGSGGSTCDAVLSEPFSSSSSPPYRP